MKLYPTLIIPPIPSKQTIGDYAIKQSKAREDATMIAQRKRMLQTFLNRVARHPILSNEHVFHRFLDGEVSWVGDCSLYHLSEITTLTSSRMKLWTRHRSRYFQKIFLRRPPIIQLINTHHLPTQSYPIHPPRTRSELLISISWMPKVLRLSLQIISAGQWKRFRGEQSSGGQVGHNMEP